MAPPAVDRWRDGSRSIAREEKGATAAEAGEGERRRRGGGWVGDLGGFCFCAEVDRSAQTGYAYAAVDAGVQPSLYLAQ
jgi:hypothetical protein